MTAPRQFLKLAEQFGADRDGDLCSRGRRRRADIGGVVDEGVMETGKAVAMAAITNIVGFGSLALSNYPGLRSVGIISSVGCLSCLITAVTLLPATLVLWKPKLEAGGPGQDG